MSELWDGNYEKQFYKVWPPEGGEPVMCWPNAGLMNSTDGSGRMWKPEDNVQVEAIPLDADESPNRAWLKRISSPARLALALGVAAHTKIEQELSHTSTGRTSARVKTYPSYPTALGGPSTPEWLKPDGRVGRCTHKFGLAGGFSECSACGVKEKRPK